MIHIHNSVRGDRYALPALEDSHLINIINLKLAWAEESFKASRQVFPKEMSRLYGMDNVDNSRAVDDLRERLHDITPYIAELFMRPSDNEVYSEIRRRLSVLTERETVKLHGKISTGSKRLSTGKLLRKSNTLKRFDDSDDNSGDLYISNSIEDEIFGHMDWGV